MAAMAVMPEPEDRQVDDIISRVLDRFLAIQGKEGCWVFDLEADTTIPSEYIILQRFLGRPMEPQLLERMALYVRRRQLEGGGWPIFEDGPADISASVKAYFALKLAGDSPRDPHMERARRLVLSRGGAARANVFTRITLALFGQIPWRTVPAMPIEIVRLPSWFFFHLDKVSYWSRTVIVPLLLLMAKRPVRALSPAEGIGELFTEPPGSLRTIDGFIPGRLRKNAFILLDRILKRTDRFMPAGPRGKALRAAEEWTIDHMRGDGGIGAIFPAMVNAVEALHALGYPENDPDYARGVKALDDLLLTRGDESFCQPCNSPIWDTCLSLIAVLEAGLPRTDPAVSRAVDWLFRQQLFVPGDWCRKRPGLLPGGWAFQFENALYPDVDDTSMVLLALLRAGALERPDYREPIARGVNWIIGMQGRDGGWGAFDPDNNHLFLNEIPFADHGALLDPSTSDVSARCVELLAMLGYDRRFPPLARGLKFLLREQEASGAWFGRWGVNYIYGTWSVLAALRQAGETASAPHVRKAVGWLLSCQNGDGGWGESCLTYNDPSLAGQGPSTASQTAWALMGLMAAGETGHPAVAGGIRRLADTCGADGTWRETLFTGTGFPKVFYLHYHGYSRYFPLWALGIHRRLTGGAGTLQDASRPAHPPVWSLPALALR